MVLKRQEKDMAKARGGGARQKWESPVPPEKGSVTAECVGNGVSRLLRY